LIPPPPAIPHALRSPNATTLLAEQHLDSAEDHAENADALLNVMNWLMHRSLLNPLTLQDPDPASPTMLTPPTSSTLPVFTTTSRLTLLTNLGLGES
jgi:hypothetical protein